MPSEEHVLQRISKWSIDKQSVEQSDHGWSKMFWKQLQVPVLVMLMSGIIATRYDGAVPGYYIALMIAFMAYSTLPALGAYYYSKEVDTDA